VMSLVGQVTAILDGSDSKHYVLVQQGAAIVLYGISSIIGIVATGLLIFCLYDIISHWFHAMRFHACQNKVKRVHEAFLSRQGELSLCPYCVTSVSNQPCSSHVVFLCGHRFHMECANQWFAEEPQHSGRCAICDCGSVRRGSVRMAELPAKPQDANALPLRVFEPLEQGPAPSMVSEQRDKASVSPHERESSEVAEQCRECTPENDEDDKDSMNSWDEAKNFMLHSLHKEYPDIIHQDKLERWCSCNTEIWLSELNCPKYKSIFAKHTYSTK